MTFLYQDPVSKETPPGIANRNWCNPLNRAVQGHVFTVLTLAGNIILTHETDLDTVLVRGGSVIPDEVCH
jgi:hypothetical protein